MAEKKTGPTFVIPSDKVREIVQKIDELNTEDPELIKLADHLRHFNKPFFLICVAPEDYVLWPDGPDIRDYQLGGRETEVTIVREEGVFSNKPISS